MYIKLSIFTYNKNPNNNLNFADVFKEAEMKEAAFTADLNDGAGIKEIYSKYNR